MLGKRLFTLPKFNSSPLKSYLPNRKGSSSNHHFSGAMLHFQGVTYWFFLKHFQGWLVSIEVWWRPPENGWLVSSGLPNFKLLLNDTFGDLFCETWKSLSWFSLLSNPSMGSTLIQAFQGKQSDLVALHRGNWCLDGHLSVTKQGLHPKNARMHGCIKQPPKHVDGHCGSLSFFCCFGILDGKN